MRRYLGAFLSIVIVAVIGVSAILLLGAAAKPLPNLNGADQGTSDTPQGTLKHVSLTLQTFPMDPYEDPDWITKNVTGKSDNGIAFPSAIGDNPDWVKYWPTTNLVVPAHALVTVTIENYDSATPLLNTYYAVPRGITGQLTVD
ncbi:MAG TPA: hypothetical protein VJR48_18900, partial [Ktedonobacterales bacterium]|nr:hypothetical protein [Ktedonobacterales bacterium]